jgi:hypothetical protein
MALILAVVYMHALLLCKECVGFPKTAFPPQKVLFTPMRRAQHCFSSTSSIGLEVDRYRQEWHMGLSGICRHQMTSVDVDEAAGGFHRNSGMARGRQVIVRSMC